MRRGVITRIVKGGRWNVRKKTTMRKEKMKEDKKEMFDSRSTKYHNVL